MPAPRSRAANSLAESCQVGSALGRRARRGREPAPLVLDSRSAAQRRGQRRHVVGATSRPAPGGTVSGNGAGGGADHRQAVRDRLGIGHAVALEARGQHEQVGRRIERGEPLPPTPRPATSIRVGKPMARDIGIELRRGRRIAACGRRQWSAATADRRASPAPRSARRSPCAAPPRRPRAAARRRRGCPCAGAPRSVPGRATVMRVGGTP